MHPMARETEYKETECYKMGFLLKCKKMNEIGIVWKKQTVKGALQ